MKKHSLSTLRDTLLLLLWGGFVLWLTVAGRLANYLHPTLQPYTAGAGVVFLMLAAFGFRSLFTSTASSPEGNACCAHGHDHAHDHGIFANADFHEPGGVGLTMLFKTLLLLLPLGILISGKGTAYSITTVQNRGVVNTLNNIPSAMASAPESVGSPSAPSMRSQGSAGEPDTNAPGSTNPSSGAPMPLQVIDLLYAVQMPSYRSEFEGKDVELVGQYVPMTTGNPRGDRFQAIRMFITCCAADAKPVGVTIQYPGALQVPEMGWIKVTGKPMFPLEGGRRTAVLEATKVEECPAPNEPFVY